MAHTVNWKPHYLHRKFTGEITGEEILKSNFDIQVHPRFVKIKYLINDFSEVESALISEEHAKIFASTDDVISDTKGKLKIAIVTNNPAHIQLAEAYRTAMKNIVFNCEIFDTVEEAKEWGERDK